MNFWVIPVVAIAFGIYSYTKAKINKMSQAIGVALMPGLFLGALVWCLISGNYDIIFLDIVIIGILIACLYFGIIRFK